MIVRAWPPLAWGERTVTVLSDGLQRLDGGAMFGVVPRVLWEKALPPDDKNRIRLGMNCLLIDGPEGRTVIETGSGGKDGEKFQAMYGIDRAGGLPARLEEAGAPPETIDRVVLSHLHFDHAGGATTWAEDGETAVPAFPNATYHVSRAEYETAMNPNERTAASYFPRNFQPLEAAGVLEWAEDGSQVAPGIRVFATPGHTLHHLAVSVDDGSGRRIVFLGDLVPTAHHLPNPWVMAYDLFPLTTLETKKRLLPELHDQECLCAFVHDAERPLAYLAATDRPGRFRADTERDPWLESKSAIHTNGEENHR